MFFVIQYQTNEKFAALKILLQFPYAEMHNTNNT